jgi:hypothetical protein
MEILQGVVMAGDGGFLQEYNTFSHDPFMIKQE